MGSKRKQFICKLFLPTFKAFFCASAIKGLVSPFGFSFYFTISSKLPPRKPEHSPVEYTENYADAKSIDNSEGFRLRMLPIELSYSDILLD